MCDTSRERLEGLARRLGKSIDDPSLEDALKDAEDLVKNYCNIQQIPPQLNTTVVRIARDIWRAGGYAGPQAPQQVASISRGDFSTSFASAADAQLQNPGAGFAAAYQTALNPFRKLRW